jgi:hypothetical protein
LVRFALGLDTKDHGVDDDHQVHRDEGQHRSRDVDQQD